VFPDELVDAARDALALALARGEPRHVAVKRNRGAIEEVRELYRRSGGTLPRLGERELSALYREALGTVRSMREFRAAPLRLPLAEWVPSDVRARLLALPAQLELRGIPVRLDYDVEEGDGAAIGIVRLGLPEKLARTLVAEEVPSLDRPLRFVVHRGQRGSVHAQTLAELQERLDRPWTPSEVEEDRSRRQGGRDDARHHRQRERDAARVRGEFKPTGGRERDTDRRGDRRRDRRRRG
jgi:ATP-dependent helicase HrpA